MTRLQAIDRAVARYLKVSDWLRKRYQVGDTLCIIDRGQPSRFKRLESLAWSRFQAEYPA